MAAIEKVFAGKVKLEDSDVDSLSEGEMLVLANAPDARHGKRFQERSLNAFFYGANVPPSIHRDGALGYSDKQLEWIDHYNKEFVKEKQKGR